MQLHGLQDWISGLTAKAAEFVNKSESYVIGALVNFRDKRGELNFQLRKLQQNPPPLNSPASLRADYNNVLTALNEAKARADWLGGIADQFTAITGLGALPAVIAGIPIAVMLAGVAAVTILIVKVTAAVSRYMGARQLASTALAEGKDATGAVDRYYQRNADSAGGLFGDAAQLVWPLAIVGGLILFANRKGR